VSSWRDCASSFIGGGFLCLTLVVALLVSSPGETPEFSTGKKKKKQEKVENPPTEVVLPLDPETASFTYLHGCCSCSLWHRVTHTVVRLSGDDEPLLLGIRSVWVVDSEMTAEARSEMSCRDLEEIFGPGCFIYRDPFGRCRDLWETDSRRWTAEGDPFNQ
jgi:hypothetical protein